MENPQPKVPSEPKTCRTPDYFPIGVCDRFSWYHESDVAMPVDCVAVICAAFGHEYSHSHRAVRHLADRLAMSGIPALRFDFRGMGNSADVGEDASSIEIWKQDIEQAIKFARHRSRRHRVCLIGVRLGATLAAMIASEFEVDFLVLWCPIISGRRYVRELKMLTGGKVNATNGLAALESGGWVISPAMMTALEGIDLSTIEIQQQTRTLIVERDDLAGEHILGPQLFRFGVSDRVLSLPGFSEMMLEPQFTQVPEVAISEVLTWLMLEKPGLLPGGSDNSQPHHRPAERFQTLSVGSSTETTCLFGSKQQLFGVLTVPQQPQNLPAIVMLSAGCQHHVGPNRLYVSLARRLAEAGFTTLRFDLEGIGDSVKTGPGPENVAYPLTAGEDTLAAISYLAEQHEKQHFVLLGLCSGAHTAFHAGIDIKKFEIINLVLLNPLTFYWVEGMSLDISRQNFQVVHYKRSATELRAWLKLLQGKVNVWNMLTVALKHTINIAKSYIQSLAELLGFRVSTLSRDISKIFDQNRTISLFIAQSDPGYDILLAGARRRVKGAVASGQMRVCVIQDADHTFSVLQSRNELIGRVVSELQRQNKLG